MDRLARIFRRRPAAEWFATLSAGGVPCGPMRTVTEALPEPRIPLTPKLTLPAPALGEHTRAWLATLGYPTDAVEAAP